MRTRVSGTSKESSKRKKTEEFKRKKKCCGDKWFTNCLPALDNPSELSPFSCSLVSEMRQTRFAEFAPCSHPWCCQSPAGFLFDHPRAQISAQQLASRVGSKCPVPGAHRSSWIICSASLQLSRRWDQLWLPDNRDWAVIWVVWHQGQIRIKHRRAIPDKSCLWNQSYYQGIHCTLGGLLLPLLVWLAYQCPLLFLH